MQRQIHFARAQALAGFKSKELDDVARVSEVPSRV